MPIGRARLAISDYRDERRKNIQSRERKIQIVALSLTSMVDMFAILVIFLLTNTDTVAQWIEVSGNVQLPKAHHVESPHQGKTIQVTSEGMFLGGKTRIEEAELKALPKETMLNIVADEKLPYGDVKRVLALCQTSGFENVSLAVQPIN